MIRRNIRLIIGGILLLISIGLFIEGIIGWGVISVIVAGFIILFHFKNELNLIAFIFIRRSKFNRAEKILDLIKEPENMISSQEAYHYFLKGLIFSQKQQTSKAEKNLKRALSKGLRMKNDQAMARLNLAGIYTSKRNKRLATYHIKEAKKLDKQKILASQIKEVEQMMKRI